MVCTLWDFSSTYIKWDDRNMILGGDLECKKDMFVIRPLNDAIIVVEFVAWDNLSVCGFFFSTQFSSYDIPLSMTWKFWLSTLFLYKMNTSIFYNNSIEISEFRSIIIFYMLYQRLDYMTQASISILCRFRYVV